MVREPYSTGQSTAPQALGGAIEPDSGVGRRSMSAMAMLRQPSATVSESEMAQYSSGVVLRKCPTTSHHPTARCTQPIGSRRNPQSKRARVILHPPLIYISWEDNVIHGEVPVFLHHNYGNLPSEPARRDPTLVHVKLPRGNGIYRRQEMLPPQGRRPVRG